MKLLFMISVIAMISCQSKETKMETTERAATSIDSVKQTTKVDTSMTTDTMMEDPTTYEIMDYSAIPDTGFVSLNRYTDGFAYRMKYATDDNFLKKAVYSCAECLIRKKVANALIKANEEFNTLGFQIQFFDCYRPLDVQKQMWEIYPDARYVANPYTTGSIHNRGGAVDITLQTLDGKELDMGTGFDHFGREAHHSYTQLSDSVLTNRTVLKSVMMKHGFNPITSEWWHYNFSGSEKSFPISNFQTRCSD